MQSSRTRENQSITRLILSMKKPLNLCSIMRAHSITKRKIRRCDQMEGFQPTEDSSPLFPPARVPPAAVWHKKTERHFLHTSNTFLIFTSHVCVCASQYTNAHCPRPVSAFLRTFVKFVWSACILTILDIKGKNFWITISSPFHRITPCAVGPWFMNGKKWGQNVFGKVKFTMLPPIKCNKLYLLFTVGY